MRLVQSMFTIGGYTALSRVLGFVRDILIASFLGAGPLTDAFFAAFKLPNFFRRLFAEGALNAAFVPLYARLYTREGLEMAQKSAEEIFAFLFFILLILVSCFEIFITPLMQVITPGFAETPERMALVITFTRLTFPYILFISLGALLGGILNFHHRFAAAASAPILLNIMMIGFLSIHVSFWPTAAHALAWSVLFAGVAQFLWMYFATKRLNFHLSLKPPRLTPNVQHLLTAMVPAIISGGVVQISLLIDVMLASFLPTGSVSYLYYADRLNQLPLSIIGISLSTALLPALSRNIQQQRHDQIHHLQNRGLEMALLFSVPAMVALMILAEPIMMTLFERKAFSHQDVLNTAHTLRAFALGLPAYILIKIFSTVFFARDNTRTPAKIGGLALILNIIFTLVLISPLKHTGIALATALSSWINAGLLGGILYYRTQWQPDKRFVHRLPLLVLSALSMGSFLGFTQLYSLHTETKMKQALFLTLIIIGGLVVFGITCYLTNLINRTEIKTLLRRPSTVSTPLEEGKL